MNKICTTIEQSQKLMELGIDVNTADMFYADLLVDDNHKYILHPLESYGFNTFEETKLKTSEHLNFIPAWSLSALVTLTPNEVLINDEYYYLNLNKTKVEYRGPITFDGQKTKSIEHNNLVDAAFEMICWLKEQELKGE